MIYMGGGALNKCAAKERALLQLALARRSVRVRDGPKPSSVVQCIKWSSQRRHDTGIDGRRGKWQRQAPTEIKGKVRDDREQRHDARAERRRHRTHGTIEKHCDNRTLPVTDVCLGKATNNQGAESRKKAVLQR
jgi:hypothetical protein